MPHCLFQEVTKLTDNKPPLETCMRRLRCRLTILSTRRFPALVILIITVNRSLQVFYFLKQFVPDIVLFSIWIRNKLLNYRWMIPLFDGVKSFRIMLVFGVL